MTALWVQTGGEPIGLIACLEPSEREAVRDFRLWGEGQMSRHQLLFALIDRLGEAYGEHVFECFCQLCTLCMHYGHRPLSHRAVSCPCLGADEACLLNLITSAKSGAGHDAALHQACQMVRPCMAPLLVSLAQEVGLALQRIAVMNTRNPPLH